MKNIEICKNCSTENPFYLQICNNCHSFLRTRVVNIDLWKTVGMLLESPIKAFTNIIHSEHKNFSIILIFIFGIKFFISALLLSYAIHNKQDVSNFLLLNLLISEVYTLLLIMLFAFLMTQVNKFFMVKTRFRDNLSIYSYALIPQIFALLILLPVEYALFGKYWFTFNPSPFLINSNSAYILFGIEGIMIVWSILLAVFATFAQTRSIFYSGIIGIAYVGIIMIMMIYLPLLPF